MRNMTRPRNMYCPVWNQYLIIIIRYPKCLIFIIWVWEMVQTAICPSIISVRFSQVRSMKRNPWRRTDNGICRDFCSIFKVWTTTLTVFMSLLIRRMGRSFLFTTVYIIPFSPMKRNSKNWCPMKDWTGKTRI